MSQLYHVSTTARAGCDLERLPEKINTACVAFIFGPLADIPAPARKAAT